MKVLLTGSSGFLGRNILEYLLQKNHTVGILLRKDSSEILKCNKNNNVIQMPSKLKEDIYFSVNNFKPDIIMLGHADNLLREPLYKIKKNFSGIKISQWFLDPLIKTGPDFVKNKTRILSKSDIVDTNFITTSPDQISFLNKKNSFFI